MPPLALCGRPSKVRQLTFSPSSYAPKLLPLLIALCSPVCVVAVGSRGVEGWLDLCVSPVQLRPEFSLTMGQAFNWNRAVRSTYTIIYISSSIACYVWRRREALIDGCVLVL